MDQPYIHKFDLHQRRSGFYISVLERLFMYISLNIPRKVETTQFFSNQRCSFSGFFFWPWLHRYPTHLSSQDDGCDALRMYFPSQPWKLLANCHWLLTDILLWSPNSSPGLHLELLGSAAHYLISNVNWPNTHSSQRHVVPFPSVHWFGTQAFLSTVSA